MIFAIIIAYDPLGENLLLFVAVYDNVKLTLYNLGAKKYRKAKDSNGNIADPNHHLSFMHSKVSKLWLRRFRLLFCCISKDEYGDEAFLQSAELFSNIFTGTDLVPSGNFNMLNSHKLFNNKFIM